MVWSVNKLYRLVQCCIILPSVNVALPNEHIRHFFLGGSPLGWGRRRVGKRRPRPLSLQGQLSCHFSLDNNSPDYSKGINWWCDDYWRNLVAGGWRQWFWVFSHFHFLTFLLPVMSNKQQIKFNNNNNNCELFPLKHEYFCNEIKFKNAWMNCMIVNVRMIKHMIYKI